ncbi:hypothetical protein HK102_000312, partial [Quaeritorhiza haematococci]
GQCPQSSGRCAGNDGWKPQFCDGSVDRTTSTRHGRRGWLVQFGRICSGIGGRVYRCRSRCYVDRNSTRHSRRGWPVQFGRICSGGGGRVYRCRSRCYVVRSSARHSRRRWPVQFGRISSGSGGGVYGYRSRCYYTRSSIIDTLELAIDIFFVGFVGPSPQGIDWAVRGRGHQGGSGRIWGGASRGDNNGRSIVVV